MRLLNFPNACLIIYSMLLIASMPAQLHAQTEAQPHVLCREDAGIEETLGVRVYKSAEVTDGDRNHEPPIGFGGGSAFFDMPAGLKLKKGEKNNEKYRLYNVTADPTVRIHEDHKTYTDIECVLVMTEDKGSGHISLKRYNLPENSKAELWVWLAKDSNVTFPASQLPDIKIRGADDGIIRTKKGFDRKTLKKTYRKNRYLRSSKLRVVKWELHYKDKEGMKSYSDENDDLYYFYVAFRHP